MIVETAANPASPALRPAGTSSAPASAASSAKLVGRDAVRSRAQMDAIRFGSIFLIMIHHFYYLQRPVGTIGTHFFFVLTGFLVSMQLMKLREQVQKGEIRSGFHAAVGFIKRRWMRVLPVMWIMLTCCVALNMRDIRHAAAWHYLLGSNIYMSLNGIYPDYVAHLWWISSVEQLLPIIILIFMLAPKHRLTLCLSVFLLIGPAFRLLGWHYQWNYISMRVLPPAFCDILALGCIVAVAMRTGNQRLLNVIFWAGSTVGVAMMGFALYAIQQTTTDLYKGILFDIGSTWAACALLIASYRGLRGPIGNILASPVLGYFGAISYGMAMWHLFAMAWLTKYWKNADPNLRAIGSFVLAVGFASVTYYLIERPVARMKERLAPARSAPTKPVQTVSADESPFASGELAKS